MLVKLWKEKQRIPSALLTGLLYGILLCTFFAAALGYVGTRISPWDTQYPLDQMAFVIIAVVSAIAFFAIMVVDFLKCAEAISFKRILVQFGTMVVSAMVLILPILKVMEYFEGVFARLVS
jgi:membrane protein YdbS with pleckstrin-like domain